MVRTSLIRHLSAVAAALAVLTAAGVTTMAATNADTSSSSASTVSSAASGASSTSVSAGVATASSQSARAENTQNATTAKTTQPAASKTVISGVVTKKGSVKLATATYLQAGPGKGYKVIKTLQAGSSWKYFAYRDYQGRNWYDLGNDQWVGVSKVVKQTPTTLSGVMTKKGIVNLTVALKLQAGPGNGYKALKTLRAGSAWKYSRVRNGYQGKTWYDLGGNQWVGVQAGQSSSFAGVVNKKGTVLFNTALKLQAGPGNGYRVLRSLKANSSWKYSQVRSYQGKTWYNLGGNQWVGAKSGQTGRKSLSGVVNKKGTVRLNAQLKLQAGPGNGYRVIKTLKYGTSWKFSQVRVYQGKTWYNLGANQWVGVNKSTLDWHGPSEVDKAYPSTSKYPHMWIKVSLAKQRVYLMNGNSVLYTMLCSTGRPGATTPKGTYYIQRERGPVFGGSLGGARYYVSWKDHGVYLFHSIPIGGNGAYLAKEGALLGKVAHSHGCIRLSVSDAYWMYTHIKYGTKVVIY